MTEMRDMPEPDGLLTERQLETVARTYFLESLLRQGASLNVAEEIWDDADDSYCGEFRELMRGPVCTANAQWGRHVRKLQVGRLRREIGGLSNTVTAIALIIERADDNLSAARLIRNLLDLP